MIFNHPTLKASMSLPDTMTGGDYRKWRKATTNPAEGDANEFWLRQWVGVVAVATFDCDFVITPDGDAVPFAFITWAVQTFSTYMAPLLDPKV